VLTVALAGPPSSVLVGSAWETPQPAAINDPTAQKAFVKFLMVLNEVNPAPSRTALGRIQCLIIRQVDARNKTCRSDIGTFAGKKEAIPAEMLGSRLAGQSEA
jgi:hypothetical protein